MAILLVLGWASTVRAQCYVLYEFNCSDDYTKSCDDGGGSCTVDGEICAQESQPEGTYNGWSDAVSGESGQTELGGLDEVSCGTHRSCSCREYWYDPDENEEGDEYSEFCCESNTWWPWWNMPGASQTLAGSACEVEEE